MGHQHAAEIDWSNAPYEFQLLADWLVNGKPELGWPGDPRLYAAIGVLVADKFGKDYHTGRYFRKGDTVAYRFEVWRHNEDGTDTKILVRDAKAWHEVIPELNKLRMGSRAFEDTTVSSEEWNARIHKEKATAIKDAVGEQTEHLWKLVADRQNGRTTFRGMPGSNPDKQL